MHSSPPHGHLALVSTAWPEIIQLTSSGAASVGYHWSVECQQWSADAPALIIDVHDFDIYISIACYDICALWML